MTSAIETPIETAKGSSALYEESNETVHVHRTVGSMTQPYWYLIVILLQAAGFPDCYYVRRK